jgi:CBS domain-containing protein
MMSESERVDRFSAAYNRIDHALSEMVGEAGTTARHRKHAFARKIRILANRQRRFVRYADFLLEIGELRNAIVHNRTADEHYIAVPNEETVLELEKIEQRILDPERVIPRFERNVLTLAPDTTLAEAWNLVRDSGRSRFPVYGREGFIGLLTSNGFARFCADRVVDGRLELDATKVQIADVLQADHRKDQVAFVGRNALVDDVDGLYSRKEPLEAVLITEHGKLSERPIGMICAADVAALED